MNSALLHSAALAAILGAGFVLTAPASAQDAGLAAAFASADADGDGYVSVDEYVAHFVKLFTSVDPNRDGLVTMADVPNVSAERFNAADRDGDGQVSLGEAVAERMVIFFDIDANRDGAISLDELLAYESARP